MLSTPDVDGLREVERALREWQHDDMPVQLHPGDIGWNFRFGAAATAAAIRTWIHEGRIFAVGLIDSPELVRMALAPDVHHDEELARRILDDVSEPARGVLPAGRVAIEVRFGDALRTLLEEAGWENGEAWTPLRRDLTAAVEEPGVRIEMVGPNLSDVRAAVQRAAFDGSRFTPERWRQMASAPPYGDARCLVAFDDEGTAVAAATVWSAGPGRPGLLEPVGVHRDHRGHGYGTAITVAAAAALRALGSSSATVCTRSANVVAVATYRSAGFEELAPVRDLQRM